VTAFFVTATGTDIGKTHVMCALITALRERGKAVEAIKPVSSGFDPKDAGGSDPGLILKALGRTITEETLTPISPWRFAAALSPDMAAAREGVTIDFDGLVQFTAQTVKTHQGTLLIEGVGGVMVPLTNKHTTLDWMAEAKLPLILVTGSYLGTLSHTLTAVEAVQRRGLRIAALVVNESEGSPVALDETVAVVARHCTSAAVVALPRSNAKAAIETLVNIVEA